MVSEKSLNRKCSEAARFMICTEKCGRAPDEEAGLLRRTSHPPKRCGLIATVSVARIVTCNDYEMLQSELLTHQSQSATGGTLNGKEREMKRS
jgi:hypothetical protein